METLLQDLRYAARTLAKNPGFTVVAVLTLALGIGANTAIFSVVDGVLLRALPYPEPDRVMQLWQVGEEGGQMNVSDPNFADWSRQNRSFGALAQVAGGITSVVGGSEPARVPFASVSRDFFAALGMRPVLGRAFVPEEQREGGAPAVVVSHDFWRRYLGGAPDLSGKTLAFDDRVYSVVGVMPPGFAFPAGAELWTPRELNAPLPSRTAHNWQVIGRLRPGVTLEQARQEMSAISRRLKAQYGEDTWMNDAVVVPLREEIVGRVRPALLLLLGAAGFLLLIACANVVNLLLARAAARRRELAVRLALGATRWRLVRQFLTESLVLSLAGGALGVLLAMWGVDVLLASEPGDLPRLDEIGVNWAVLAFALGVSVLAAGVLGLAAALRATDGDVRASLTVGQRTQTGGAASQRVRGALVVSQVALTLVLLVGAGLLARSFLRLLATDPGFRTEGAVVLDLALPSPDDGDGTGNARLARFHEELSARLGAIPGIGVVGGINDFPLGGNYPNGTFLILNYPDEVSSFEDFGRLSKDPTRAGYAEFRVASDGYFRAMGIPLLRGRGFDDRDAPDAPHVAVISESLAQARWPGEDPIGKLIQFGNMDGDTRPFTIVGIVGDIREQGLDAEPRPTFYGNSRQRSGSTYRFTYVLSGSPDPAATIAAARRILRDLAPEVPPRFRTLEEALATSLAARRFSLLLLGVFGAAALLLAVAGIYGVVSYTVAQRTREFGIRIALGAHPGDVLRLVVRQGAVLAGTGVALGLVAAFLATRLLASMVYGVSVTDALTFVAAPLLVLVVALLASSFPARRATRVDPMVALRAD